MTMPEPGMLLGCTKGWLEQVQQSKMSTKSIVSARWGQADIHACKNNDDK